MFSQSIRLASVISLVPLVLGAACSNNQAADTTPPEALAQAEDFKTRRLAPICQAM